MKKRTVALLLALVLVIGVAAGGTLAWLISETDEVTNTFTVGDIEIDLEEHDYVPESNTLDTTADTVKTNTDYQFVPGDTLPKDPFVTVKANSEACFLFVKVTPKNNTVNSKTIINWTVSPTEVDEAQTDVTWSKYATATDGSEIWYCEVPAELAGTGASWYILSENKVTVSTDIVKSEVAEINDTANNGASKPQLVFDAAAVQSDNIGGVDKAYAELGDWTTGFTVLTTATT